MHYLFKKLNIINVGIIKYYKKKKFLLNNLIIYN